MIESSISTSTRPVSIPETSGERAARAHKNLDATASSWRTCPKVNSRRNDPTVDGAYGRSKTVPIAPCRNSAMSAMLSAPATMPATSDPILRSAWAPLSVGTLRCSSAKVSSPLSCAKAMTGTSPAVDTRLGSSNPAAVTGRV